VVGVAGGTVATGGGVTVVCGEATVAQAVTKARAAGRRRLIEAIMENRGWLPSYR
jgi:hypothetical protein